MKARLDFREASPEGAKAMTALHRFVHDCGLEHSLTELVKLRVSQMNGCAYCIDMHAKEMRAAGDSEQRLYLLNVWRESARAQFSETELANLTLAVVAINGANRINIAFRTVPGSYQPKPRTAAGE